MEYVSTKHISLKQILLDNQNWLKIYLKHSNNLRKIIISSITKMLVCGTPTLGYHLYRCYTCGKDKIVYHTCKSRFCTSCAKKATDIWIKKMELLLPDTHWQHITFTMPKKLWDFFWLNRELMNIVPKIAADIILELAEEKGYQPGIFLAIHTFKSNLGRHFHIHLSTTTGGLSLSNLKWIKGHYPHLPIKKRWRARLVALLRKMYREGNLKLPPILKNITTYKIFSSWLNQFFQYDWNVFLQKESDDKQHNVNYLSRYLKRPPIGETRLKVYDGKKVTFEYFDYYTNSKKLMTLPVKDFIKRLLYHIHDKGFRVIRYYGFLANRVIGKKLPIVHELLKLRKSQQLNIFPNAIPKNTYITWRQMIKKSFGYDPLLCTNCGNEMELEGIVDPMRQKHVMLWVENIARGNFP